MFSVFGTAPAHAQILSLSFEGVAGSSSVVEGFDGLPSGTPTPGLSFAPGDRFVGSLTYDAGTPISDDFGTFQAFDGALLSIVAYFYPASGAPTSFFASGGSITWSAFDPVGPIEMGNSGPISGPEFSGFGPVDIGPDFEDPTSFFPSSTLPILDAVGFPADTLFLLFENSAGEYFDVNSPFAYTAVAVPEPGFATAILVGTAGVAGVASRRSQRRG